MALEGDYARAIELFEQTMPLFRAAGDTRAYIVTVSNLASVTSLSGDHERARALNEEALELGRGASDRDQMTISLHNLGRARVAQGLLANCLEAFGSLRAEGRSLSLAEAAALALR